MTKSRTSPVKSRTWRWRAAALLLAVGLADGGIGAGPSRPVPAPRAILGFDPGADYQLADFAQLREYFQRLDASTDRVKVLVAGHSSRGNEMLVALISSAENLARVGEHREVARRLALAGDESARTARDLARRGKAIVWIDNGLHASEVATSQHALELAYELATSEDAAIRAVRDNVILVLLPCVNPDGLDMVVDWYRRHRGTPHQDSALPWLYQSYVGHDNNRDFFMQTQPETEVLNRLLYREWLPQILYNQHQGIWPARMFVPPFPAPVNPHIDPQVIERVDDVGATIARRLASEGRDGVISRYAFSAWYNGSIRTASYFHNMIGILTEVSHASATPHWYDPQLVPRTFSNGVSAHEASETYPRPWRGGTLRLRDSVDYMMSGSLAVLEYAARHREELLFGIYEMGRRQISLGTNHPPVAYVVPARQHDAPAAMAFLDVLMKGGVQVRGAARPFSADGVAYPEGTHVILLAQPFRPFARDLIEPQRYPDLRGPSGQPMPPYDAAGWTLAYQMGIRVVAVERTFDTTGLELLHERPRVMATLDTPPGTYGYVIDPSANAAFIAVNRLVAEGAQVERLNTPFAPRAGVTLPAGAWVVGGDAARQDVEPDLQVRLTSLVEDLGLRAWPVARAPAVPTLPIRPSRLGIYRSWVANIDEGWTRWVLEQHAFAYRSIHDRDLRAGYLRERYDTIILPSQTQERIVRGHQPFDRAAVPGPWGPVPPEYQGGIGEQGVAALREFVRAGGTLIALDAATDLVLSRFGSPFSEIASTTDGVGRETFYCPGSVLRVVPEKDHPATWGMAPEAAAFFQHSRAFWSRGRALRGIARYAPAGRVLMSGWLLGEPYLADHYAAIDVPFGDGRVILFGFRPHFRGQSQGTFKLLFNLLMASGSGTATALPHVPSHLR